MRGLIVGLTICLIPVRAHAECWGSSWRDEAPAPTDKPDEIICMSSATEGIVRESFMFGTGVEGCNKVTATHDGEAVTFAVDYSKCTNDSPSHTVACKSLGDINQCVWTFTDGDFAGKSSTGFLVRIK